MQAARHFLSLLRCGFIALSYSFLDVIRSTASGRVDERRDTVVSGRERHGYCRPGNVGNPMRSMVTDEALYIRNFTPDRRIGDVDGSPTKSYIEEHRDNPEINEYYKLCFGQRPEEELYLATDGPDCIENRAAAPAHADLLSTLRDRLHSRLRKQGDPRVHGRGWIFECYPYFGHPRNIPQDWPDLEFEAYQLRHLPEGADRPQVNAVGDFAQWK